MKFRALFGIAAVSVTCGAAILSQPAQAALTTYCSGTAGAVTVPGDLVVAAGKSCTLDGTTVTGNVRLGTGADLIVTNGTFAGTVTVGSNAYLDTVNTSIAGRVNLKDAFGAYFEKSQLGESVVVRPVEGSTTVGFVFSVESTVTRDVNATVGDIYLDGSTLGGSAIGDGVTYLDAYNTVIEKKLSVSNADLGAVVCDSEVYGDGTFASNSTVVQLGGDTPISACSGSNYFGANVAIDNNTATVNLVDNIVRGNLSGVGNDPAPTGEGNRVRGTSTGQFAELSPSSSVAARVAAPDRKDELQSDVDSRRSAAKSEATAAGPAAL